MEIRALIQALGQRRKDLLSSLDDHPPEALAKRPESGGWSPLEIVEHLIIAERDVLRGLPDPSALRPRRRSLKDRLIFAVVMFFLRFGLPLRVPSKAMIPKGGHTLRELASLWDENIAWVEGYASRLEKSGGDPPAFHHPAAGPMNLKQTLRMDLLHIKTHTRQIQRML